MSSSLVIGGGGGGQAQPISRQKLIVTRMSPKTKIELQNVSYPRRDGDGHVCHQILQRSNTAPNILPPSAGRSHPNSTLTGGCIGMRKVSHNPKSIYPLPEGAKPYGQDVAFSKVFQLQEGLHSGTRIGIALTLDGHGRTGHDTAALAATTMILNLRECLPEVVRLLMLDKTAEVEKVLVKVYADVQAKLRHLQPNPTGGSTCACVLLVEEPQGRRWVIGTNKGDSEAVLVNNKTGAVMVLSELHSVENPREHKAIADNARANDADVRPAVYARFSCVGGKQVPNAEGAYQPTRIYDIDQETGVCTVNERNAKHIHEFWLCHFGVAAIGGGQSLRRLTIERLEQGGDGAERMWVPHGPLPGTGHQNWGSTLQRPDGRGGTQMTRGFGDWPELDECHCLDTPHVYIHELDSSDDVTALTFSDGVGDVFYLHEIGVVLKEYHGGDRSAQAHRQRELAEAVPQARVVAAEQSRRAAVAQAHYAAVAQAHHAAVEQSYSAAVEQAYDAADEQARLAAVAQKHLEAVKKAIGVASLRWKLLNPPGAPSGGGDSSATTGQDVADLLFALMIERLLLKLPPGYELRDGSSIKHDDTSLATLCSHCRADMAHSGNDNDDVSMPLASAGGGGAD